MLRTVRTNRLNPRLIGFRYCTTTGDIVFQRGENDFSDTTDNSTGNSTFTLRKAFARVPIVVATPDTDIDATGAMLSIVSSTATAQRIATIKNDNTAADGTVHAICYGWDHASVLNPVFEQRVRNTGIRPRLMLFTLSDTSTLVEGKYLATATASSEQTTLTFKHAFQFAPTVIANSVTAGNTVNVVSTAVNKVVVAQYDSSGSAGSDGLHVLVLGWDSPLDTGQRFSSLKAAMIAPRIIAGRITVSGGTPAITNYADLGAITDGGVGVYTLTYQKAFKRAPCVVASMSSAGTVAVTASSTTACTLTCQTHAGAAVDPSIVHVLVCGADHTYQVY